MNINSIQNKFEELKLLNDELKALVLIASETKIDCLYPDDQFSLQGYQLYRKDRVKGGDGLIAYFSTNIPSKKLKLPKAYKTLEAIAVECSIVLERFYNVIELSILSEHTIISYFITRSKITFALVAK